MTEALYESIVEESNDGIFVAQGGDIIYANEKLQELTGYSNTELVGSPKTRIVAPAHSELVKSHHWARMEGEAVPNQFEIDLQTSAGERVPVELSVSRITAEGEPASVSFCRDLLEQKERERTLEGIVSKADNIVEATSTEEIGQVAVDIARDVLGAPLAGMHLLSEDSQCLEMVAAIDEVRAEFGVPPTYKKTAEDTPSAVVWEAFESTEPVYIDDAREYATLAEETPARSAIVEPLGDHGVFIISATEPQKFDQTDRNLVELLTQILTATLDRQKRERELEQSRKRIRGLFDESPDMINVHDSNGVIVDSNPQLSEKLGYTTDELVGKHIWEIDQLADPTETREVLADIETGERFRVEGRYQCKDGSTIPVEIQIRRLALSDGDEFLVSSRDITERKEREQELEWHEILIKESIDVPTVIDATGTITYISPSVRRVLGYEPDELLGKHGFEFQHPDDREDVANAIETLQSSPDSTQTVQVRFRRADGSWCWIESRMQNFLDHERIGGIIVNSREITERKEYEQELESQRDNLEILNQVVRHDIRNDLQIVSAYAEKCQTYVDEDGEEYLTKALEASRDAVDITETARDITETMLQSSTDLDLVNLRYVLDREVDDVRSNYEQGLITVEGSIPDVKIRADDMLESVFRNLLGNAIQHNDKEIPEVTVSATAEDDTVVIEVADNGPGIPDDRKEKIFEESEQGLDSQGSGLGLYLVETLIERYNGDIRVADNEPDGAVFITTLPIAE